MKLLTTLLVTILLTACGGGGSSSSDDAPTLSRSERAAQSAARECSSGSCKATTIIAGCDGPAVPEDIDDYMRVPEDINTTTAPTQYEPKFGAVGHALKQWVRIYERRRPGPCSPEMVITRYFMYLKVVRADDAATRTYCQPYGTTTCAEWDPASKSCVIHITDAASDEQWGHELWHCVDGEYHP